MATMFSFYLSKKCPLSVTQLCVLATPSLPLPLIIYTYTCALTTSFSPFFNIENSLHKQTSPHPLPFLFQCPPFFLTRTASYVPIFSATERFVSLMPFPPSPTSLSLYSPSFFFPPAAILPALNPLTTSLYIFFSPGRKRVASVTSLGSFPKTLGRIFLR